MAKPNLFIVGAPRCGTGSLWAYLKGHPEIFMSAKKELYFFDCDLQRSGGMSTKEYLGHFAVASDHKKIGEASPSYLRSRCAPQSIKAFSPGAQIIIMLRNPVDMLHSLHSKALYCSEPIVDFAGALEADVTRTGREMIGYREFIDFPEQVQRYFDQFGRENVHTIIYDDLEANSKAVGQNTLRFLGVRQDIALEFPWVNSNEQIRIPYLEKVLCHPPPNLQRVVQALIPRQLRPRIQRRLSRLNATVRPRAPIDPALRMRLQAEFEPKVDQLSNLLGRDLSGWYKD